MHVEECGGREQIDRKRQEREVSGGVSKTAFAVSQQSNGGRENIGAFVKFPLNLP